MLSKENLMKAGVVTILVVLAQNFTSTESKLIQGGATFGAVLAGLFVATKL